MFIRQLDRDNLVKGYNIDAELLLPWGALNAPFEGAWCVLREETESTPHSHHEYEIFIAMTGQATLVVDDERRRFEAGDIAHMRPGSTHYVINDSPGDFEFYAIWWDDTLSARFIDRHRQEAAR
jgi:mannose-6-phosphate isomerase-like protein (cupin superfamily)